MPLVERLERLSALGEELCRTGRNAGLDAVGVCDAAQFDEARAALKAGLDYGWDAGMHFTYRNPSRSTDPARALGGATALVVGALRYDRRPALLPDDDDAPSGDFQRPEGVVARYAWQDHYRSLREALSQVADHLREQGWRAAVLVDDNALVDRAAAVRAGLGWYGKNTNVLIPGAGSWFVLGSVVTDAPLLGSDPRFWQRNRPFMDPGATKNASRFKERAQVRGNVRLEQRPAVRPEQRTGERRAPLTLTPGPVEDGCGTCRRCIAACPTGALTHDDALTSYGAGHLDARKCLAWLVQAPGVFPLEYRIALHDRMYGCDDCQEVCPVNRLAARSSPPPPADHDATVTADILGILGAGDDELLRSFGRWYIADRDPRFLRRNALVVLGNIGDPSSGDVRTAAARAIAEPDPLIRAHGVWAAARLGYRDLIPEADAHPMVQQEIDAAASVPSRSASA